HGHAETRVHEVQYVELFGDDVSHIGFEQSIVLQLLMPGSIGFEAKLLAQRKQLSSNFVRANVRQFKVGALFKDDAAVDDALERLPRTLEAGERLPVAQGFKALLLLPFALADG